MTPVGAVSNRTASAQLETLLAIPIYRGAPTKPGERKCLFIFMIHYSKPVSDTGIGRVRMVKQLTSNGIPLDMSPDAFGELRASNHLLNDASALRERMAEDGYLLLRNYLDLEWVMDARRSVLEVLAEHEMVDESQPLMDARAAKGDQGNIPLRGQQPRSVGEIARRAEVGAFRSNDRFLYRIPRRRGQIVRFRLDACDGARSI